MINASPVGREEFGAGRDVENMESCDSLFSEVI